MLTSSHRKITCLEVLNFWNSSELRRGFSRENITTIVNAVSAKSTRPQKVPWQLLIKNMSLWESEKSCWHTKKGLFCAPVCPSYLRFPAVSSPDIPRRPPSHQCPTQRKRLELNFSFKFYAIGKGREYDIFQVQVPNPSPGLLITVSSTLI